MKLTSDCFCTGIHGVTGQEIDEGTLPAGTEICGVRQTGRCAPDGTEEYEFKSLDQGRWFTQRTYGMPVTDKLERMYRDYCAGERRAGREPLNEARWANQIVGIAS